MSDIDFFSSRSKQPAHPGRSAATAQTDPQLAPSNLFVRIDLKAADREPAVLRPYSAEECITTHEAARRARRSVRTIRRWVATYLIGRPIGGSQIGVSIVALEMVLNGDGEALAAYLAGDRTSRIVVDYFERSKVPLPRRRRAS